MADYVSNPLLPIILIIGVLAILFYKVYDKGKFRFKYKPKLLSETDEFKMKLKTIGTKINNGKLYIGFHMISHLERYLITKAKITNLFYDPRTKDYIDVDSHETDSQEDMIIIQGKNRNVIFRLLGMKKQYFMLKLTDDMKIDGKEGRIFLPIGTDLHSYGNIWLNNDSAIEYVNDLSIKRQMEQQRTELENMPQRVVLLNVEQAMKERYIRALAETEKLKYDEIKKGSDTVVT